MALTPADSINLLENLVAIPSPSGEEEKAAAWLANWMAARGFDAQVDAAGNAVGTRGGGPRQAMLLGHIDTFPGDLLAHREEDWLYGRGTVDAKGPLCAFAAAVASLDISPGWQVTMVGAVEEEAATSRGARHIVDRWPMPDVCIIGEPSGWDRVTLGYKGRLLVEVHLRAPFAHSAGKARLPAEQAVDVWNAIVAHCANFNTGRPKAFGQLDPSLRHIATRDEGAYGSAQMSLGFRLPLDLSPDVLADELRQLMLGAARPGPRGEVPRMGCAAGTSSLSPPAASPPRPARRSAPNGVCSRGGQPLIHLTFSGAEVAFRAEKNTPLVRSLLTAIRGQGGRPRFVLKTGTSDMNIVGRAWGCPIVAYGPGDSALDHTPEERINLGEYLQSIEVLKSVLCTLMHGKGAGS
jgi:LysW-gamma-L-lysine carboxypeptidase